jgi:hypothetical protein
MDIDPLESATDAVEGTGASLDRERARLGTWVAITVALLATFLGVCKVKDDNIVQAMQQAQADKIDHWGYYQARNLRQQLAEASATQVELAAVGAPAASRSAYDAAAARYRALEADQLKKKDEVKAQAEEDQRAYDRLNYRDDQFDLSDALLAIAIAMLAVTALTGLWALYWAALIPTGFGILMGLAGLVAWPIHPDALMRLLS